MSEPRTLDRILEAGVIAVLRGVPPEHAVDAGKALVAGGVNVLEVTAEATGAATSLDHLHDAFDDSDVILGAGTVLDASGTRTMLDAGAEFVVSPILSEDMIRTAHRDGILVIPGVMTPNEAMRAAEAGVDAVKVFPAGSLGPGHLSAMAAPLPQLTMIPTGGITLENGEDFLSAGAAAIGLGSALVSDRIVAEEDWDALEDRARAFTQLVDAHPTRTPPND